MIEDKIGSCLFVSSQLNFRSKFENAVGPFEYDPAGTVLALGRQYSRSHVRKAPRGESFHIQYWKAHKDKILGSCLFFVSSQLNFRSKFENALGQRIRERAREKFGTSSKNVFLTL